MYSAYLSPNWAESTCPIRHKCYLSAVRFFHISAGHGDPFGPGAFPRLQYVLRGVKRVPKPPARPRLPITPQILRGLKSQWSPLAADQDYVMLWAACCIGFWVSESWGVYIDSWARLRPVVGADGPRCFSRPACEPIDGSSTSEALCPKKVSCVVGPSVLCVATGTPKSLHVACASCRATAQVVSFGGPRNRKSSK